jgi:hypothetical protein
MLVNFCHVSTGPLVIHFCIFNTTDPVQCTNDYAYVYNDREASYDEMKAWPVHPNMELRNMFVVVSSDAFQ